VTTCNIGTIQGGTRANVIAADAQAEIQIRLVTPVAPVKAMLEQAVGRRALVEYLSVAEPVQMIAVEGFEQCVVRFTTDIPYLTNWGTPLLLGPGSILNAHTDHERIHKQELSEAVDLYTKLVLTLMARAPNAAGLRMAEGAGER
jgi:acetylornithine deacetylase